MPQSRSTVRHVLIVTLILNVTVALAKIFIGMASGALAITADGFHSLMDGAGNIVALIANHISNKPPDEDHPYGHQRFETVGALVIGVLLMLTAWEVVQSVIERVLGHAEAPQITPLTVTVLVVTLLVNIGVSTYQRREGRRLQSQLILADAENTRADVYVTGAVLLSSGFVLLGIAWMDTIAALIVVALICRAGIQVLRSAGGVLVDTAPYSPEQLAAWTCSVPAVDHVYRARSRGTHNAAHIDIDVQVAPNVTLAQTADLASAIRCEIGEQVQQQGGSVHEIEVHFLPL